MTEAELELVLAFADSRVIELDDALKSLRDEGRSQDQRLGDLERRLGVTPLEDKTVVSPRVESASGPVPASRWDDVVASAQQHYRQRGADLGTVDIESLMDPDDVAELRRLSLSTATFRCRLDAADLVLACVAGLTAGAVDAVIVKVPRTMWWDGEVQTGSSLTERLRNGAIPADNWLARIAKVPFDSLNTGQPGPRLDPQTHRADTFGHDPFVGLVFGVVDILRGTSTGVGPSGQMFVLDIADPVTTNPLAAIVLELSHLFSDVFTRSGLPLPGWSLLRLINVGSIDDPTIGELSRSMYRRGYDSWHLLSMSTSVAAAELVLRSGWALRTGLDETWAQRCDDEARLAGTTRTSNHPRFLLVALLAHGIAAAVNAGKIAALGGNPLAWNAAQWGRFAQVATAWWGAQSRSMTDAIVARSDLNLEALLEGWPES